MEIPEITAYRERLEKEYLDLLSYRKGILAQIDIDKAEAEKAKIMKDELLKDNAKVLKEAEDGLNNFKKEKEVFVKSLATMEAENINKAKIMEEKIKEAEYKKETLNNVLEKYGNLIRRTKDEEKALQKKIKEQKDKEKEITAYEKEIKQVRELNQSDREQIKKGNESLRQKELILEKEKERFELEKEAVAKQKEQIEKEKEIINKERLHLYSQQQSLKLAYEEVKQLNANTNR